MFTMTNIPGSAATVDVSSGNNQTVKFNKPFPSLVAEVTDQFGNPVSGATVKFTVNPASSGADGSFPENKASAPGLKTTSASGLAVARTLKANGKRGSFTVTVSVGGAVADATFYLTVT